MLLVPYHADDTTAERLYDAGRILKHAELCDCEKCLEYRDNHTSFTDLARKFYAANAGLVLRAICEEWGMARITLEVNRQPSPVTE